MAPVVSRVYFAVRVHRWRAFAEALFARFEVPFASPERSTERQGGACDDAAGFALERLAQGEATVEHREEWDEKWPMELRDRRWLVTLTGLPHGASLRLGEDGSPPFAWFEVHAPASFVAALSEAAERAAESAAVEPSQVARP